MHTYKRWVIITASLFLCITASAVNASHLYYMAALLLVLPCVSYVIGMLSLRDLHVERIAPDNGWAGEEIELTLVARNLGPIPKVSLRSTDHLPQWLQRIDNNSALFNVLPHSETRIHYKVAIGKRGVYQIDSLHVEAMDPLGIFWFGKQYPVRTEIIAYPVPKSLPALMLTGADRHGMREFPVASSRGSGIDPDGIREYVPGDPMRRVHWRSTARTGHLSVVEFEEAHALTALVVLDTVAGYDYGKGALTSFECMVEVAASVSHEAIRQGASVRIVSGDSADGASTFGRGTEHLNVVLARLARATANNNLRLSEQIHARVGDVRPGTTLYVITSAQDSDLPAALSAYSTAGIEVVIYYADLSNFDHPSGERRRQANAYIDSMMAVSGSIHSISYGANGELIVEPIVSATKYTHYAN